LTLSIPIAVQSGCRFVIYVSAHSPHLFEQAGFARGAAFTNQSLAKQILRKSAFAWLIDRACKRIAAGRCVAGIVFSDNNIVDYLFTAGK